MSNDNGGWTPGEPPKFPGEDPKWQPAQAAAKPGIISLRPLSFGEILEGSFALFRRHAGTVLGVAAALALFQAALTTALILAASGSVRDAAEALQWQPPADAQTPEELLNAFGDIQTVLAAVGIAALVSAAVSLIGTGLFTVITAEAVIGRAVTPKIAWNKMTSRLGSLVATTLLAFVVFIAALALLIAVVAVAVTAGADGIAGFSAVFGFFFILWATFRFSLINTAVVLERVSPVRAFKRSWILTKGAWWRTFGMVIVASVAAAIVAGIISAPLVSLGTASGVSSTGLTPGAVVSGNFLSSFVQGVISVPFVSAAISLLYVDLRMRKEGLAEKLLQASQEGK